MAKRYRIALVGMGGIAHMHANAIKDLAGRAELVAGAEKFEQRGRQFAAAFGCKWYPHYEQMFDAERPDLACICTPSGLHLEPTVSAAERGIHVLCEKPLEITTDRVDRMIDAAERHHVILGGIFPMRFNPAMLAVRDAAAEGRFGAIAYAGAFVPWWRDDAYYAPERWQGKWAMDGGGALMNQSIHGVDALQWIVSASMPDLDPAENPVAEVYAYCEKRSHDPKLIEVEDTAVAVLRFRNGALAHILGASSMYPGTSRRLIIGGRDGMAEVVEQQLVMYQFRTPRPRDEQVRRELSAAGAAVGSSNPLDIGHLGHLANLRSFLDALDEGHTPTIDAVQSRKAVAIITAVYESARTHAPVKPHAWPGAALAAH